MSPLPPQLGPDEEFRIQDFPALAGLRLGDADLQILTQQGFLNREAQRGNGYLKLRFRRDGKQCVRHVGARQAAAVLAELDQLQAAVRSKRKLVAITRGARRILRQSKPDLQPILESDGYTFHGLAIRRRRRIKPNELKPSTEPTRQLMNFDQTPQSKAADQELNAYLPNTAPDEPLEDIAPDLRLARILDYEAESLAKPVALEACIGSSNGTLMALGCHLADVIKEALVSLKIENFARVQPVMDAYLRCMGQVDRYSHFEAMLTESRRKAEEAKAPVQRTAQRGISNAAISPRKSARASRWQQRC